MELNYKTHQNTTLFSNLADPELTNFDSIQNYVPIYERFFALNKDNFNTINLNHVHHIKEIKEKINNNTFHCEITSTKKNNSSSTKKVFFKFSPLLDPIKFITGKYENCSEDIIQLPTFSDNLSSLHKKIKDVNNAAYVDSFFTYLTSQLQHHHDFSHGVDFYGSFLGIKNDHLEDITDDFDYLEESSYFYKNQGKKFSLENSNGAITSKSSRSNKPTISMSNDVIHSPELSIIEDLTDMHSIFKTPNDNNTKDDDKNDDDKNDDDNDNDKNEDAIEPLELTESNLELLYQDKNPTSSLKSNSSSLKSDCSSRSSNTDDEDRKKHGHSKNSNASHSGSGSGSESGSDDESHSDMSSVEEDPIFVKINKFPVQLIALECCEKTLDSLILDKILSDKEWGSIVMQILMTLITYQKAFKLTHNDLHSNNIMYVPTDKKHIFYTYKKRNYKVPTFGRLFKIIDYGRAIYKYKKKLICSDSFHKEGDASTQYNCEPYMDENKPRLEPNFSFDLCRLGCSIFDYLIEDLKEVDELDDAPIIKIITDWCKDDKGRNIMYKVNGQERYPEFKLYKMIARTVHNHTPDKVLENVFFHRYLTGKIKKKEKCMNIDKIPEYHK